MIKALTGEIANQREHSGYFQGDADYQSIQNAVQEILDCLEHNRIRLTVDIKIMKTFAWIMRHEASDQENRKGYSFDSSDGSSRQGTSKPARKQSHRTRGSGSAIGGGSSVNGTVTGFQSASGAGGAGMTAMGVAAGAVGASAAYASIASGNGSAGSSGIGASAGYGSGSSKGSGIGTGSSIRSSGASPVASGVGSTAGSGSGAGNGFGSGGAMPASFGFGSVDSLGSIATAIAKAPASVASSGGTGLASVFPQGLGSVLSGGIFNTLAQPITAVATGAAAAFTGFGIPAIAAIIGPAAMALGCAAAVAFGAVAVAALINAAAGSPGLLANAKAVYPPFRTVVKLMRRASKKQGGAHG